MKIVKQFALENGDSISAIGFFVLVALIFILIVVHSIKMKRTTTDELANLALKNDTE
ncbi:MAG: hypothetical protein ACSHX6_00710 [Akkermansiaceae bacterium]